MVEKGKVMRNAKGQLLPGSKLAKGRGAKSLAASIRDQLQKGVLPSVENLAEDLASLTPKERLQVLPPLMAFFMPRLQAVAVHHKPEEKVLMDMTPAERAKALAEYKSQLQEQENEALNKGIEILEG